MFEAFKIKNLVLKNRVVMPPMFIDAADCNGKANDFHLIHYTNRAIGGAGLIIMEATAVSSNGRITETDLGIWDDSQIAALLRVTSSCHQYDSKIFLQLAHSGRKCELKNEIPVAPTSIKFSDQFKTPIELSKEQIANIVKDFKDSSLRALKAGFDGIEIHAAHGYLIHEFLSPITNKRKDDYGGNLQNRIRFLREILQSIREVWPEEKPIFLRVSASDYTNDGISVYDMVDIVNLIKDYVDVVHVSSGGLVIVPLDIYPGYQVNFCEIIKKKCKIPTIAVGLITLEEQVEEILKNNRADLVSLGRELLRNPYWVLQTAYNNGIEIDMPSQYKSAFKLIK
jgi:NADPH2 dehydrogenase